MEKPGRVTEGHAVLLVDDEENVLNALIRLLRKENYRILTTPCGEEGLKYYDLVEKNKELMELTRRQNQKLKELTHNLERLVEERTRKLKELQKQLVQSEKMAALGL